MYQNRGACDDHSSSNSIVTCIWWLSHTGRYAVFLTHEGMDTHAQSLNIQMYTDLYMYLVFQIEKIFLGSS